MFRRILFSRPLFSFRTARSETK